MNKYFTFAPSRGRELKCGSLTNGSGQCLFAPSRGRELKFYPSLGPCLCPGFAPSRGRELKFTQYHHRPECSRSPPRGGGN